MKSRCTFFAAVFFFVATNLLLSASSLEAQSTTPSSGKSNQASARKQMREAKAAADQAPPGQKSDRELADLSNDAAGRKESGERDENAVFKQSPSVKYLARRLGISREAAYWLSIGFNFLVVVAAVGVISKKMLPAILRSRSEGIRKNLEEAQRASADANRRLRDIEQKLAQIGTEISGLEKHAAAAAAAEQARLQSAAEEEKQRIVRAAEQEIAAAANSARRDLRSYAAELAIGLAEKKIKVDTATDQALVRDFVERLGKNEN
jgi:F-type H+-transporting ATPase subunit b